MKLRALSQSALAMACLMLWAMPAGAQEEKKQEQQEEQQTQAADAMMEAWQKAGTPGEHHEQLAALVGTWNADLKFWMDPSAEPLTSKGTIDYSMIMDGRYLREEVNSEFMGQPFHGLGTYGYNNVTGQLESSWIDDMSTGVYTYEGSIGPNGKEFVLKGTYTDPVSNEVRQTRTVMQIVSPNELHYETFETRDGKEVKMMEMTATRKSGSKM